MSRNIVQLLPELIAGVAVLAAAAAIWLQRRGSRRITERSRDLEKLSLDLLRSNRMKSEFLANISHELRTPLNAIVGFIELLRDGVYGELSPRQTAPVDRIQASANHLRHLVDQVLDLARMAAGRMEFHPEPTDPRPVLADVVTEMESLATERKLALTLTSTDQLPRISTDPTHVRQILVNLIGNALKFTESGGVTITAKHVDHVLPTAGATGTGDPSWWIAVEVYDTGIGIAPADHARIFDEFEQVNAGPRGESMRRGTGLGLPISRRLATLVGGDITVTSQLGSGSTFTLWLPAPPPLEPQPINEVDATSYGTQTDPRADAERNGARPGTPLAPKNPLYLREQPSLFDRQ